MNLKEMYGMVEVGNTASENVLKKLGLSYVGSFTLDGAQMKWYKIIRSSAD